MVKDESGISITEIMVAVLIMAIALIAMMYMFQFSIRHTSNAGGRTIAVQLAKAKIEELRGTTFNAIDDSYRVSGNTLYTDYLPLSPETFANFPGYTRQSKVRYLTIAGGAFTPYTTASDTTAIPPTDLIEVTVRVGWTVDGAQVTHEETTVIYNSSKK